MKNINKKLIIAILCLLTLAVNIKAQCTQTNSPTFSVVGTGTLANQGSFTLGCSNHSLTVINIVNPNTNPIPGGALVFGYIPPGGGTVYTQTLSQFTVVSIPGTWSVVVKDIINSCETGTPVVIFQNILPPPTASIAASGYSLTCSTTSVLLSDAIGTSSVSYWWGSSAQTPTSSNTTYVANAPATYSCKAIGTNGCLSQAATVVISVGTGSNGETVVPLICEVSTDSTSSYDYNIIYWDYTQNLCAPADSFYIYRWDDIASHWWQIGRVPNSVSVFIDNKRTIGSVPNNMNGIPAYSPWKYAISAKNNTLGETNKSPYHITEYIKTLSNGNFSISPYVIENTTSNPITGFTLLRDNTNSGVYNFVANVPGSANGISDPQAANFPNANYRVDITYGVVCNVTSLNKQNGTAALKQKGHSNVANRIVDTTDVGIKELKVERVKLSVYPNPANSVLNVELSVFNTQQQVLIYNTLGVIIKNEELKIKNGKAEINVSQLPKGIYFIKIGNGVQKFVKE